MSDIINKNEILSPSPQDLLNKDDKQSTIDDTKFKRQESRYIAPENMNSPSMDQPNISYNIPPKNHNLKNSNSSSSSSSSSQTSQENSISTTTSASNLSQSSNFDPFAGLSFKVGVAENKNSTYRSKMEDVHTYIANFAERVDWGYFAIFDGHAGKDCARWCGNNLHTLLEQEIDLKMQDQSTTTTSSKENSPPIDDINNTDIPSPKESESSMTSNGESIDSTMSNNSLQSAESATSSTSSIPLNGKYDMKEHLYKSFLKADDIIEKNGTGTSGCTAAVAVLRWESENEDDCLIDSTNLKSLQESSNKKYDFIPTKNHKRMLYTSNVGDSRIILCRKGKPYRLSYDHKASDSNEINRIEKSGGLILKNRVNGVLAVTRSLGDTYMKDLVLGKPFTTSTKIDEDDEFLIIACDGVWDVLSDAKACKFVSQCFAKGLNTSETSKKLCQLAIDNSTMDNVTVMIVQFDKNIFKQ
ncbi:MgPP2CL-1 [Candida pseudojiufengensis]|uniref:MgPP2CL-1 n=1 Tax=Candida pseudojiufengensis TaxID=497109 RepID=UPI0022255637|nr:MgPP2CL-1 [Candida pseudojiufengensis]KAI5962198.1 MgPP2CL-1 [Candida pseudojiufengensis]